MATKANKYTGFVLYEGPSVLDGKPIVVIATMKTANKKTGQMVQTWILRSDMHPLSALESRADESICGGCIHRRSIGGACYVNVGQAPAAVYKAYKAGSYSHTWDSRTFQGKPMRMGAYGDPAAVPFHIWESAVSLTAGHTGYTHQIGHKNFDQALTELCMVSADTPKAASLAHSKGHRTFRVKPPEAPLLVGEIVCLADSQGITCADCKLCDGKGDKPSIAIDVHGSLSSRYESKYRTINLRAI